MIQRGGKQPCHSVSNPQVETFYTFENLDVWLTSTFALNENVALHFLRFNLRTAVTLLRGAGFRMSLNLANTRICSNPGTSVS